MQKFNLGDEDIFANLACEKVSEEAHNVISNYLSNYATEIKQKLEEQRDYLCLSKYDTLLAVTEAMKTKKSLGLG